MKKFNTECIVLKSINYKDSDKIYTFYSKDKGKFSATAKGVRKLSSRRGGSLDTLNHVIVNVSESTHGLHYISEVTPRESFGNLKNSLEMSIKGYYILELVHRFTEDGDEHREIFELLLKTLKLLNKHPLSHDLIISYFELSLMKKLGYALTFDSCVSCQRNFSFDWDTYRINLVLGGLICSNCRNGLLISENDARFLNLLEKGKFLRDAGVSRETLSLIKLFIKNILEDNFRTAKVFGTL